MTPLATKRTEQMRKNIQENAAKVEPVSPKPRLSAAENDKNELPFQNECPAIDSDNAEATPRGVWIPGRLRIVGFFS